MKQLTILLLFLITTRLNAQEKINESSSSDYKRVQIGINLSPDICFRKLENNDGSSMSDVLINIFDESQIFKIGYTAGLNVCYNLKKNVSIETGLHYSNKGYQTKMQSLSFGTIDPSIPNQSKFVYNFYYIDIPVKANFTIGKKKLRFFTSVGLTTNIFIKETVTSVLIYSNRTDRKANPSAFNYNNLNLSPTVSIGIDYKINSKMNLRIEPTFRYGLLTIIDSPITGYLYSGGLNIAYCFGL
jgi:hypothetical protein